MSNCGAWFWLQSDVKAGAKSKFKAEGEIVRMVGPATDTRLGKIIEQSINEIYVFDAKTLLFCETNRGARENLGYTIDELLQLTPLDIKPEFTQDRFEKLIDPLRSGTEEKIVFETVHRRKDGSTYDVEVHVQLMLTETPPVFVAFILDVTERKIAERELRASEAKYRTIVDTTNEGFWRINAEMRIVDVNDAICRMLGYSRAEILGMTPVDFVDEAEVVEFEALIKELLVGDVGPRQWEGQLKRKDGTMMDVHNSGTDFIDKDGRPNGRFAFINDITEQKRAERKLRQSEDRYAFAVEGSQAGLWDRDIITESQYLSPRWKEILGYEDHELENTRESFIGAIHPDCLDHVMEAIRAHLEDRTPYDVEYRAQHKDGRYLWIQSKGQAIWDDYGNPLRMAGSITDITEQKLVQDALIEAKHEAEIANQAKSEFLASMSHDLRTPLNAILGFADMISHQYFGPVGEKYREYAVNIRTSGSHLLSLLSNILDLSEIESGKKMLCEEVFDLLDLFAECDVLLSREAQSAGVELNVQASGDKLLMCSDRHSVMQVLLNLLSNSIKFTPPGGNVTLSALTTDGKTVITVEDTGSGIEPEKLLEITEPFVQGQHNPYLTKEGWGLGLAIVKSLANLLDGEFDIQSQVGRGTTVHITLPKGKVDQGEVMSAVAG